MMTQRGHGGVNFDSLDKKQGEFSRATEREQSLNQELWALHQSLLLNMGQHWNIHSLVTLKRQALMKLLYLDHIYKMALDVPGIICEFGVQWGGTLAQLINLRGMYEPYNYGRTIVGFDTFEGFVDIDSRDGQLLSTGDFATTSNYDVTLERLLIIHESFSPLSHIKKFELVKGDAAVTIEPWLKNNPHALIAMAIFDMDLYKPTKEVLERIRPRLTKGSLLVFDELNCPQYPGETIALAEVLGLPNVRLRRYIHSPYAAWVVVGDTTT